MNYAKTEFFDIGGSFTLKKKMLDDIKIGETKIHYTPKIKFLEVYLVNY